MNSRKLKKTAAAAILCFAMVIGLFSPCMGISFSAGAVTAFPAPVLSAKAKLLKETPTPNVSIQTGSFSDKFSPTFSSSYNSSAPVISNITAQANPDSTVVINGKGFSGGSVWVCGIDKSGSTVYKEAQVAEISDTDIKAIISRDFIYGMFYVWVKGASGIASRPVRVNGTTLSWLSADEIYQGAELDLHGKNLTSNNGTAISDTTVYFTSNTSAYKAEVVKANPYKVTVKVPSGLADGTYTVWAHNGHGGNYGWSGGISITVKKSAQNIWTGKTITVTAPTQAAIENAIERANDYDTIYLPKGRYNITSTISLTNGWVSTLKWYEKTVRFVGEGDGSEVVLVNSIVNENNTGRYTNMFYITRLPSEFKNITFEENVDIYKNNWNNSPVGMIYVNPYQNKENGLCNEYIKVTGCRFIQHKLTTYSQPSSTSSSDYEDYSELLKCYNEPGYNGKYGSHYSEGDWLDDMTKRRETIKAARGVETLEYISPSGTPLQISAASKVYVSDCYFEGSDAVTVRGCDYVKVVNNEMCAKAVMWGNSGSLFIHATHSNELDISNNFIYGKGYDEALKNYDVETGEQSLCRAFVVQLPSGNCEGNYISENKLRRVADNASNSGELILYESLGFDFMDKPASVSNNGKTITFNNTQFKSKSKTYKTGTYTYWYADGSDTGPDSVDYKLDGILNGYAIIVDGTGESQYRKIESVTSNSVTVDREWDIAPSADSTVVLMRAVVNSAVYKNDFIGSSTYRDHYNASAGIQAYATMLGFVADTNTFVNVNNGIFCDSHASNKRRTVNYNTHGTNYSDLTGSFNWFMNTILMNNTISGVDRGIEVRLEFSSSDDVLDGSDHISTTQGIIIRNNDISYARYSKEYQYSNGNLINAREGLGSNLITVGSFERSFTIWSYNKVWPGDWIKNTVIEGNELVSTERSYIRLRYHQSGTFVRNNNCDNISDETRYIEYDTPWKDTLPEVIRATVYTDYGTTAEGMYGRFNFAPATNGFENSDFSEGLKYWTDASGRSCAGDNAAVVTVNSSNYVKLSGTNGAVGITSAGFRLTDFADGDKIALMFDYRGSMPSAVLSGRGFFKASDSPVVLKDAVVLNGFNRAITSPVSFAGINDTSLAEARVTLKTERASEQSTVGNIELVKVSEEKGYFETLSGERYYLSDGGEYGGTEGSGLVPKEAGDIFEYFPEDGLKNADFAEGFKYWTDISGTRPASSNASVSSGKVTMRGPKESGIMSAPFKINKDSLSSINSENRVAFIIRYTSGTSYTVDLYKNGVKTGTASTGNNAAGKLKFIYFTGVTWDENAVYNIAVKKQNAVDAVIDSISLARCTSGRVVTEFESGAMYASNAEIGGSESGGMSTSSYTSDKLINGDFAMGLKYWIQTSAAVSGREVTLASGTLKSMSFRSDKGVYAVYRYKTASSGATVSFGGSAQSIPQSTQYTYGTVRKDTTSAASAIEFKGDITLSYVGIVTLSGGIYTDIKTGEQFNASDLSPYGGTYENGFYKTSSSSSLAAIPNTETFVNGDFSEGFKFWTARFSREGYASDFAALSNGVVTLNGKNDWDGISSIMFKLPNAKSGRQYKVVYDYKGDNSAGFVRIYNAATNSYKTNTNPISTDGRWHTYSFTGVDITSENDLFYFDVSQSVAGYTGCFRNIRIYYVDEGNGEYVNLDNSPVGCAYGDINCDGSVDLRDYVNICSIIAGRTLRKAYFAAANLDKDSDVNITATDLTYFKEYLLTGVKKF